MTLRLIEALSAPGYPSKPNDDAWAHADRLAAVIDGATDLGEPLLPGASDAAWLAHRAAAQLALHAPLGAEAALAATTAALEDAYARERLIEPLDNWRRPFASMMLVEAADGAASALSFGDCAALVGRPGEAVDVIGEAFDKRVAEAAAARQMALDHGGAPGGAVVREVFLPALRKGRARYNTEGGPWILGAARACASHAKRTSISAPAGTVLLLASDGFLALGTDYGRYDAPSLLAAARRRGLGDLLSELRGVEAEDPYGALYPRFKTSDDATALLLEVM
jgi:hypothetical protein